MSSSGQLIGVHIASSPPQPPAPTTLGSESTFRRHTRGPGTSRFASPEVDWQELGFEPRWLGNESSDCVAAIDPSIFSDRGGTELTRFLTGAKQRDEIALIVATVGNVDEDDTFNVFGGGTPILLPDHRCAIHGKRLPIGTKPALVPGLRGAEKDLALRLLNRPADAPWWSLRLEGLVEESFAGREQHPTSGRLEPLLLDGLGAPILGVWISDGGDERWYLIPDVIDPISILDWLSAQAIPEFVPAALERTRSSTAFAQLYETRAEGVARQALDHLDAEYERARERLRSELQAAFDDAAAIRDGLLFGTGSALVDAVASVLRRAGLTVEDLDESLGATRSADLLASAGDRRVLVEVKSAGGAASERLVDDLERHMNTWPQLRPGEHLDGGGLVVNHQHQLDPRERDADVFRRPEFVAALSHPVLSTMWLLERWRHEQYDAIQAELGFMEPGSLMP